MKCLLRWAAFASVLTAASVPVQGQDAKLAANSLKYSRDFYAKVHLVAIATLDFGPGGTSQFKYDRYPEGGPERILAGDGSFARAKAKESWLRSDDWGETGKPVDAQTAKRLNNWVGLIEERLNAEPALKFVAKRDEGERETIVFEAPKEGAGEGQNYIFGKYKSEKSDTPPLLSEFSGPMRLGTRQASVKISFSYLVSVKMVEAKDETAAATTKPSAPVPAKANSIGATDPAVKLLDGKLTMVVPTDFARDPDDPKEPKSLARFTRKGGAWGQVLRGTKGLTLEKLPDYLKTRVAEYTKGFNWLPKDTPLTWLRKEIVTIDGRTWADWRYVPMKKGAKGYQDSPLYTRFLTTSYKGQLLEVTFTSNLNTEPELKEEIDRIMDSVHLEK
jgi:hypothetical protein